MWFQYNVQHHIATQHSKRGHNITGLGSRSVQERGGRGDHDVSCSTMHDTSSQHGPTQCIVACPKHDTVLDSLVVVAVVAFSSLVRILGGRSSDSFPVCAVCFFSEEISLHTPLPLFKPGSVHSGSASWDDSGWVQLQLSKTTHAITSQFSKTTHAITSQFSWADHTTESKSGSMPLGSLVEWHIMSQQSTAWHSWTLQNTLWYNITLHRLSWQGTATHNNQMHLNTTTCHSPTQHSVMCISSLPDRVFFPVTADHNKAQHNTVSCAFLPSLTECFSLSQQITTKLNTTQGDTTQYITASQNSPAQLIQCITPHYNTTQLTTAQCDDTSQSNTTQHNAVYAGTKVFATQCALVQACGDQHSSTLSSPTCTVL